MDTFVEIQGDGTAGLVGYTGARVIKRLEPAMFIGGASAVSAARDN